MRLIKNGINERNLSVGSKGGAAHRERQVPRGRRGHSKSSRRWPADASRLLHSFPEDSFVGAGLESPQSCTLPRLAVRWCDLGRHPVNRDHWARTQEWKIFFNVFQVNLCCGRLFFLYAFSNCFYWNILDLQDFRYTAVLVPCAIQ